MGRDFYLLRHKYIYETRGESVAFDLGESGFDRDPGHQVVMYRVVLSFKVDKQFPYVTIQYGVNSFGPMYQWPGYTKITLEGNFSSHFTVSTLSGQEQGALQILTPDFMEDLMSLPGGVGVEFSGSGAYIVSNAVEYSPDIVKDLFAAADILAPHLTQILDTWQASNTPEEIARLKLVIEQQRGAT